MAQTIAASSADTTGTSDSTGVTVTLPAGIQKGDLLLCFVGGDGSVITPPSAWKEVAAVASSAPTGRQPSVCGCYSRDVDGAEAATYKWTGNGLVASPLQAKLFVIRGGARSVEAKATNSDITDNTAECLSVTTALDGDLLFVASAVAATSAGGVLTATPPGGYTERCDFGSTGALVAASLTVDSATQGTHGSTGTQTITWSATPASGGWASLTIAVQALYPDTFAKGGAVVLDAAAARSVLGGADMLKGGALAATAAIADSSPASDAVARAYADGRATADTAAAADTVARAAAEARGVGAYITPTIADIIDSFDRANAGSLGTADSGGAWAAGNGTWSIVSNKAAPTAGAGRIVTTIAHKTNGLIEADIATVGTVNTYALGFVFRYVDSNNFLSFALTWLAAGGVIAQVSKYDTNVQTALITKGSVYRAGDTVRASIEFSGATLRAFVDGNLIGTYSMTTAEQTKYNAATTIGLISFSSLTGGTIDNFRAATITADSITRSVADGRVPADSAPAADAASRSSSAARAEADTATAADALTRAIAEGRATADSAPGSDSLGRSEANARALADSGPTSDAVSRSETAGRLWTDSAPVTDALGRALTDARSAADTSPAVDALDRALGSARFASDNGPANDATGIQGAYGRAPDDPAAAVDDLASASQRERDLSGSAPSADGITRGALTGRTAADSSPSSDAVNRAAASLSRSPADNAPSSGALQRASDAQRATASSAGASDVVHEGAAFIRGLIDPLATSDVLGSFVLHMRALADISPAIAALMRAGAFLRQQHDSAPASGKAKARVPTPYVPSPTRADADPSQNALAIDASRNEADVVLSANANDVTPSKNSTDVVRSRTRAEVKR